jgi:hypothetical protein
MASQVGTFTLSGKKWAPDGNQGYTSVSLKLISGTVTYVGDLTIILSDGSVLGSSAQTLDSSGFFIGPNNPLAGFVVDATSGVVEIAIVQ